MEVDRSDFYAVDNTSVTKQVLQFDVPYRSNATPPDGACRINGPGEFAP